MVEAREVQSPEAKVQSRKKRRNSTSPRPSPQSGEGEDSDARQCVSMGLRPAWVSHQRAVRERWKVTRRIRRLTSLPRTTARQAAAATGFGFGGGFIIGRA